MSAIYRDEQVLPASRLAQELTTKFQDRLGSTCRLSFAWWVLYFLIRYFIYGESYF